MFSSLFGDDNEKPRTFFLRNREGTMEPNKMSPLAFRAKLEAIANSYGGRKIHIDMVKDYAHLVEDPRSLDAVKSSAYMRESLLEFMGAVVDNERKVLQESGGNATQLDAYTKAKKLLEATTSRLKTIVNFKVQGNLLTVECDGKAVGSLRIDPQRMNLDTSVVTINGDVVQRPGRSSGRDSQTDKSGRPTLAIYHEEETGPSASSPSR